MMHKSDIFSPIELDNMIISSDDTDFSFFSIFLFF